MMRSDRLMLWWALLYVLVFAVFVAGLAIIAHAAPPPDRPDPVLSPGIAADISVEEICATAWGRDARHVSAAMKREVLAEYHTSARECPSGRLEIDHVIPRELGGADDVRNLAPMCYERKGDKRTMGARHKDRLENRLHRELCAAPNVAKLKAAQEQIRTDWIGAYHQWFGGE